MRAKDIKILEQHGWTVECESPLEIRHTDGSFATMKAAHIVVLFYTDNDDNVIYPD